MSLSLLPVLESSSLSMPSLSFLKPLYVVHLPLLESSSSPPPLSSQLFPYTLPSTLTPRSIFSPFLPLLLSLLSNADPLSISSAISGIRPTPYSLHRYASLLYWFFPNWSPSPNHIALLPPPRWIHFFSSLL